MQLDWNKIIQIVEWLGTAIVGAAIVKIFDALYLNYKDKRDDIKEKAKTLMVHVDDYAKLADLYRFYARASFNLVPNNNKTLSEDWSDRAEIEQITLIPEEKFDQAINQLTGVPIAELIVQRIVQIRIKSAEMLDIARDIDPTGNLKELFTDLYIKTVYEIGRFIENKNQVDPERHFDILVDKLKAAKETRQTLRDAINKYR